MFKEAHNTIVKHKMLDGKSTVIVALSGGADSMCLLHYLVTNSDIYGITVSAAHVNHCLRGEESESDYHFVENYCKQMNVPFYVKRIDIKKLAKERKIGLEQCGREERYSFFKELSNSESTVIATAHTASDNAETILLNITRGCGIEGLTGIPPVRGNIIRPLINTSRNKIEQYCQENSIPFVTDSSNLSDEYSRNKIRLSVIPTLSKINPSVEESINRLAEVITKDSAFINKIVESEYIRCFSYSGLDIELLNECDSNVLPAIIKYAVNKNLNIIPEKRHIDLIEGLITTRHGAVMLSDAKVVRVCDGRLIFINDNKNSDDKIIDEFTDITPKIGGKYSFNDKTYYFSISDEKDKFKRGKINKKLLNQRMSCDIISCDTTLRRRKCGDIFKPIGRNCTKTVKKLFNELKIPRSQRNTLLLLAKGSNVFWIEGVGASQDALPQNGKDYFTIEVLSNR